jgi:hypothetical protein
MNCDGWEEAETTMMGNLPALVSRKEWLAAGFMIAPDRDIGCSNWLPAAEDIGNPAVVADSRLTRPVRGDRRLVLDEYET